MKTEPDVPHLIRQAKDAVSKEWSGVLSDIPFDQPPYRVLPVPVPKDFAQDEAFLRLCRLLADILSSGVISERELAKRLIRHHPAQEGV